MIKYILYFVTYLLVSSYYLHTQYSQKIVAYEQSLKGSLQRSFKATINTFEVLNDSYYDRLETKIACIIKDATGGTVGQRDTVRYILKSELMPLYNSRKLTHLNNFHIFDGEGRSLLRFHRPEKYDDVIAEKRDSLRAIQTHMVFQKGFEVGAYLSAYRFQYPLFYDGEYVGSYEFGIQFDAINKEMQKLFGVSNILFIDTKVVHDIAVGDTVNSIYKRVEIGERSYYVIKSNTVSKLYTPTLNMAKRLGNKDFQYFSYGGEKYIAISLPIYNITGRQIGAMLTSIKDTFSGTIFEEHIIEILFAVLLGILALALLYRDEKARRNIHDIINIQKDIIIITNEKGIVDVNQSFLNFFSIHTVKDFIQKGSHCICDYFIDESGYLQKEQNGISWIEKIESSKGERQIAILEDKTGNRVFFKVTIEGLSQSNDFIIKLSDATEELKQKNELEEKIYFDTLTGAYSRERFDHYLDLKLKSKREFSLVMFDIDHFKAVNDNYGHDVGDRVLKEFSSITSRNTRKGDIFARWGGEEFMLILDLDIHRAEYLVNNLKSTIEKHPFNEINHLTCSYGIVERRDSDTATTILKRVDGMLYAAKKGGRNCVVAGH